VTVLGILAGLALIAAGVAVMVAAGRRPPDDGPGDYYPPF
jgi:hypothetical protein